MARAGHHSSLPLVMRGLLATVAALAACTVALWVWPWVDARPLPGIRLGGLVIPRNGPIDQLLSTKANLWGQESLVVETGYHEWHPTRQELGAHLSVEDALADIRRVGRSSNPLVAFAALWRSWFGSGHDLRWRAKVSDEPALDAYLELMRARIDRLPVPGTYDPEGKPIEGIAGEALDVEATKRAIRRAIVRGEHSVKVATVVTSPPHTYRRFDDPVSEAGVLMMSQETEYRPNHNGSNGRAVNIELAAQKLNGHVILPGEVFSYNDVVGKREAARGFMPAAELMNGEVVDGIGGGVCQVAGTLHAAAFFAGLFVEEYRPHSRLNQFAYLRPGLDTMVAWPDHATQLSETKDMRLRNPYPFPVLIKTTTFAKSPFQNVLRVELWGASKPFRVDWHFEEIDRVPAGEIRRSDPALPRGTEKVTQNPLDGIVIMRHRTIFMPTGRIQEDTRVAYPPTPRIVSVGEA